MLIILPKHGIVFIDYHYLSELAGIFYDLNKVKYVYCIFFFILGVRDYIHVMDLATGHVAALNMLQRKHQRLKASVTGMFYIKAGCNTNNIYNTL